MGKKCQNCLTFNFALKSKLNCLSTAAAAATKATKMHGCKVVAIKMPLSFVAVTFGNFHYFMSSSSPFLYRSSLKPK